MTRHLSYDMQELGFLARSNRVRDAGHSRRTVETAIASGQLTRPARGWLATRSAERDAVIAVLHRGVLTDASALGSRGLWRGLDRSIHVLVPPNCPGLVCAPRVPLSQFTPYKHATNGVVKHWGTQRAPVTGQPDWRVSVVDALASFARSHSEEMFVAAVDHALHADALRVGEVPLLFDLLPARLRASRRLIHGEAESGTESLTRLRLRAKLERLGHRVEIQVPVGHHRIDILIDGWLAIEADSEEWHASQRLSDLRRDAWLTARGYRVERYDYQQVMYEWNTVEAAILEILRTARPARAPR